MDFHQSKQFINIATQALILNEDNLTLGCHVRLYLCYHLCLYLKLYQGIAKHCMTGWLKVDKSGRSINFLRNHGIEA